VQLPGVGGVRCDGENDGAMCTCIFRLWYEDLNSVARHREHDGVLVCWNSGGVCDAGEAGGEGGCAALHALNWRGGKPLHCTVLGSRVEQRSTTQRKRRNRIEERAFGRLWIWCEFSERPELVGWRPRACTRRVSRPARYKAQGEAFALGGGLGCRRLRVRDSGYVMGLSRVLGRFW
jgi:hypothetical protein